MSVDCEQSARSAQGLKLRFGELPSNSGSTKLPQEVLHRGSVPQALLAASPSMQSCQRRGRALLNECRKPQHPSLIASQMQRKRSSSLGAEVSLTIDHSYVPPVQPEEVDGNAVSASPKKNRKLSSESCSEVAAADGLEKKADLEEGSPLGDKEVEQEGGPFSSDGSLEREQLLQELANCRNQIQAFSEEAREWERGRLSLERTVNKLQQKLNEANALTSKGKLKRWHKRQGMVNDLCRQPNQDDVMEAPLEVMRMFIESERLYLNSLTVLDFHYQQPMRTLSGFKPEVLSLQQLDSLFLNCSELLLLHRYLYEELSLIQSLPESIQLDQFFSVLEKVSPSFSLYNCFVDSSTRQPTLQRELRLLQQKPEFAQLLQHCQSNCEGKTLQELLSLPSERLSEYSALLTRFHASSVRGLSEEATKRAGDLIHFVKNIRYELLEEKSEWDHTLEKIKLLHKLVPDRPIPMEIFNSDVHLIKQGPLTQVVSGKELPRFCFLFSKYIAVAERVTDTQYRVLEHGMIPLYGAQLHKCVDVEGQAIAPDLQSGLKEDLLAFRLSFVDNESLFFRAAKPNQRNTWIQTLEKSIQDSQRNQHMETEAAPLYPDVGPKIAAASMEKLFQQLTSPHKFRDDFMEVFLMTHSCFTSPQEVLTALLNCIKQPDDRPADSISQGSGSAVFSFEIPESEHLSSPCMSTSNSLMDITSDSEPGTPTASPSVTRRSMPNYPPSSLHARQQTDRKEAVRSSLSTSDSDSSPHTSAVVVDDPLGGDTKNGWTTDDPEMTLKILPRVTIKEMDSNTGKAEDPNYVTFYRHTHNGSDPDSGDNECSDVDDGPTPRPSVANTQIFTERGSELLQDDRSLKPQFLGMSHSLKLAGELDEASQSMQELMDALSLDFQATDVTNLLTIDEDNTFDDAEDQENLEAASEVVRRRSRTLSEHAHMRHSVLSTISLSEPDLTQVGLDLGAPPSGETTSLQPRRTASPQPWRTTSPQQRHNSEPQYELTASLSFNGSPFHHGTAMTSLPASPKILNKATHQQEEKATSGKSKSKIGKLGKKKKSDTLPHSPARYGGKSPQSLFTKSSSSMSFTMSGSEYAKNPKGKKSWMPGFRKKSGKKIPKSTSMEAEESLDKSLGLSKGRRSLLRKHSFSSDTAIATPLEDRVVQGSPLHRHRAESTSQGASNLVSKIFSVLGYWQREYFEDFEQDVDLRQTLEDFLRQLVSKSCSEESLEVQLAQQLLDMFEVKMQNAVPPNCSFPTLLARVTKCDPQLLYIYDWGNRDKLMEGREIDLSTRISKDSPFLRTLAEQLTLMEFSIYAAIQRRELLNCNWKKPDKEKLAPNVCRLIRRTNEMTSWVCTEILTRDTPAARATVIEHFIQIAMHSYNHNDMHCALNITVALASSSIKGLSKTWEEVDKKYRHKFEKMKVYTDYHGRCRKMRERLEQIIAVADKSHRPSALPYIGAYLDQIYSLEMNSKTCNPDGLVNFAKMTKLADLVRTALQYQSSNFKFEPRLDVIAYVTAAQRLSENELYELSIRRESSSR